MVTVCKLVWRLSCAAETRRGLSVRSRGGGTASCAPHGGRAAPAGTPARPCHTSAPIRTQRSKKRHKKKNRDKKNSARHPFNH